MLELPDFDHMTKYNTLYNLSQMTKFFSDIMDRNYDDITFSHNQFCRLLETQKKLKELKVCIKMQCISVFLDITKADNFQ